MQTGFPLQMEPWTQIEIHIKPLGLASILLVLSESLRISLFCEAKFRHYIKYSQRKCHYIRYSQGKCHSVPSLLNLLSHLHTTALVSKQDLRHGLATRDRGFYYFQFILATVHVCFCVLKVTILGQAISPNILRI